MMDCGIACLFYRPDKQVRRWIHPIAAESITTEKFTAISNAAYSFTSQRHARPFKETVIKRAMHTQQNLRANRCQSILKMFCAQQTPRRVAWPRQFEKIEV